MLKAKERKQFITPRGRARNVWPCSSVPFSPGLWTSARNIVCACIVTSVMSNSWQPRGLCSPPGSSVHGILQERILEWVALLSSRGSSWPRDWTHVSYVSCMGRRVSPLVPPGKPRTVVRTQSTFLKWMNDTLFGPLRGRCQDRAKITKCYQESWGRSPERLREWILIQVSVQVQGGTWVSTGLQGRQRQLGHQEVLPETSVIGLSVSAVEVQGWVWRCGSLASCGQRSPGVSLWLKLSLAGAEFSFQKKKKKMEVVALGLAGHFSPSVHLMSSCWRC